MRKTIVLTLALLLFALTPAAYAQQASRLAVLDGRKVLRESAPGKFINDELVKKFEPLAKDLERQRKEVEKLRTDLQNQGMALSLEARQDKELEFKRKFRDLQDATQNFKRRQSVDFEKLSSPLLDLMGKTVKAYGEKNNIDLIVDSNAPMILTWSTTVDITDEVLKEVDGAWDKQGKKF